MGDFETEFKGIAMDKLEEFCELSNFKYLIQLKTCYTKDHKYLNGLILTRKTLLFQRTHVTDTDLSYSKSFHLKPKTICHRNHKIFNESAFLKDVTKLYSFLDSEYPSKCYNVAKNRFFNW